MPDPVLPQLTGKKLGDSEKAARACQELENDLHELHAAYDMYFLGQERKPPTKKHEDVKKRMLDLKNQFLRQTAVKFRVGNLQQKLLTYERLWERTLKEIENGTYSRDVLKARKHRQGREEEQKKLKRADADFHIDEDLDVSDLDEADDLESAMEKAAAAAKTPVAARPVAAPAPAAATRASGTVPAPAPAAATRQSGNVPAPQAAGATRPSGNVPAPAVAGATRQSGNVSAPAAAGATRASGNVPAPQAAGATRQSGNVPAPAAAAAAGKSGVMPAITPQRAAPVGTAAPQAGARPAPAVPRPSASPAPVAAQGGLTDGKIKAIYDAYVMAKKRCGEDTTSLSLASVSDTLKKQVPELMKQHKAKSVEFKVVIKDGKAVLRALPKE